MAENAWCLRGRQGQPGHGSIARRNKFVISGFNTDIEYKGVRYHVQTEDKGRKTPVIMSLVYHGGTILASKRSPYDDLVEAGFDEATLEARVQRQHKLICAAINAGRIEDLKRMSMKEKEERPSGLVAVKKELRPKPDAQVPVPDAAVPPPALLDLEEYPEVESPEVIWDIPMVEDVEIVETPVIDGNVIIEEEIILPPDAVKVIGDIGRIDSFFEDELKVKLLGSEVFESGDRKDVNILVYRGKDEVAVAGAGVMIKVLGSDFRPQIFHAVADSNGVAAVSITIPEFRTGRAAVLVRAMVGNEEAEMRRSINHKRK